jgi:MFS family permease
MTHRVEIWLLLVLGVGAATAVVSPLVDAVYTDVSSRMGSERKHMIGLASSTGSLAYVVGPIVAGALATVMSEPMVFSVVGGYALLVGIILLIVTPKKIHLPQAEIDSWR